MSKSLPLHCLFYVNMNKYFCFYLNIARDVVTVLLTFVNIHHFTCTFSHAHTEAHPDKHTCMSSTQEEWQQPDTGAWFGGAKERLLLEAEILAHTLCARIFFSSKQISRISANRYLESHILSKITVD